MGKGTDDVHELSREGNGEKARQTGKTARTIARLILTPVFCASMLYLAGLSWVAIKGADAPAGVRWFYPYLPRG